MISWILIFFQMAFANSSIQGEFSKSCFLAGEDALSSRVRVAASSWTHSFTAYEEASCETPYLTYEVQSVAAIAGEFLDLETRAVSYTSLTDEVTRALNLVSYCGFRDWKTGKAKFVTGLECDEFQTPKGGEKTYTRWKLVHRAGVPDALYLGAEDGGFTGKTPESRHRMFETSPYLKIP